jgi:hypothetical protein
MAAPRYEVAYSDLAEAWRIWDARIPGWCRLGRPPVPGPGDLVAVVASGGPAERDALELCWDDKPSADRWLIHCYQAWGEIPTVRDPHAGDRVLGFAAA